VLGSLFAVVGTMWLYRLGSESFWFDEAFSVRLAGLGTAGFVDQVTSGEGNMILYHLLLRATIPLCSTDVCLRSLSVLLMLAALFVSYLLFLRLTGKRIAILAVVFLAFNGFAFNYAREARGYALLLFLVLLSTLFFVRAVDEPGSKGYWIAYAVTAALSVYTHFYAASMLLVHASGLLGLPRERRPWRSLTLAWVATGLMLTPIFVYLAVSPAVGPRTSRPTLRDLASLFARLLGGSAIAPYWFLPALILGPLFLWGIVNLVREVVKGPRSTETWHKALLLAWSTIPATIAYTVVSSEVHDLDASRRGSRLRGRDRRDTPSYRDTRAGCHCHPLVRTVHALVLQPLRDPRLAFRGGVPRRAFEARRRCRVRTELWTHRFRSLRIHHWRTGRHTIDARRAVDISWP
jgi:Dolichyl-phosphate-mannose-protein mannosyltransferase